MQLYKDSNGTIYGIDADQDHLIQPDWVEITEADIPVPVAPDVTSITKLAFTEWCEANTKLADLMALLDADAVVKFKWDAATSLAVDHPLVVDMAPALGITDVQAVFNEIGG